MVKITMFYLTNLMIKLSLCAILIGMKESEK